MSDPHLDGGFFSFSLRSSADVGFPYSIANKEKTFLEV